MTASIIAEARRDPLAALLIVLGVALLAIAAALYLEDWAPADLWPHAAPLPVEQPPAEWRERARNTDVMTVPGYDVAYWGRPDRPYNGTGLRPRAIVWHYPVASDPIGVIRHITHRERGHRGYHFLIDQWGRIYQSAPLTRQTRHVKERGHRARTGKFPWLDNSNSIGVTIMDGCVRTCRINKNPCPMVHVRCKAERVSPAAKRAGHALARALMDRYGIPCRNNVGHGELQTDRADVEGSTMSRLIRDGCE